MKVLTTQKFVAAIEKLPQTERQDAFRLFELVSQLSVKEMLKSSFVQVLIDTDEKRVFILHTHNTRIYCTLEKIENFDTAVFIGFEIKEVFPAFPSTNSEYNEVHRARILPITMLVLEFLILVILLILVFQPNKDGFWSWIFPGILILLQGFIIRVFDKDAFGNEEKEISDKGSFKS